MKELSIEEKAKRYDEAIERAKSKIKNDKDHVLYEDDILDVFPELTKSENEKIKKEIISALTYANIKGVYNKHITWLEKQGEQKTVDEIAKEVCKDKASAVAFLKSAGIMNEKGELTEQYRQGEQKPSWSEEDEEIYRKCICAMRASACGFPKEEKFVEQVDNWLKSLKDRVQPKQEWSEKDKCMLNNIIDTLNPLSQTTHSGYAINSMVNWLKSLKDRYTWKPSDEQMEVIEAVINNRSFQRRHLDSLYEQLKKLRRNKL